MTRSFLLVMLLPLTAFGADRRLSWLSDSDPEVRIAAAESLARTADLAIVGLLVAAQDDAVYRVADSARRSTDRLIDGVRRRWQSSPHRFELRVVAADHTAEAFRRVVADAIAATRGVVAPTFDFDEDGAAETPPDARLDILLQPTGAGAVVTLVVRDSGLVLRQWSVLGNAAAVTEAIRTELGLTRRRSSPGTTAP